MGAEFNKEFGSDVAITLTPVGSGRLEVYLNGSLIFDRKAAGKYPNYTDVSEMKMTIMEKVPALK
ncbi:MAG: hypothetical protein HY532_05920 [Chloroflexi bacterium]|nr:hypothetical protein [Chloroflexota bacterium]